MSRLLLVIAVIGMVALCRAQAANSTIDLQQPIADVCSGAAATGSVDDTTAINCQLMWLEQTYGGGQALLHCGSYLISGAGVVIPPKVRVVGDVDCAVLFTNTDSAVVSFQSQSDGTCPQGNHFGAMESVRVYGFNGSGSSRGTVYIGQNCNVTLRDVNSFYGAYGLWNDGVDSHIWGGFIWGHQAALNSGGANWYTRVKFDQPGSQSGQVGYQQRYNIVGLTQPENHFVRCDFTGSYPSGAIVISDTGNSSVTTITNSVITGNINLYYNKVLMLSDDEIGGNIYVGNENLILSNSWAPFAITVSGPASKTCSNKISINGC
ncbi:exported hypothetical protein [Bradyrhizobium sp. STM 3843]|uniref:hypothetical protein n=1 Tax=Bradyrhizobium sp. STM 3843 TaxID=551947 RepID=UPI00024037C7|nr:hypothetical protein [Bradyrhizobium sp. STM 3843]CCE08439.1 exported hypothetical protein [Bradyrhizobium sp. STM 3843]